MSPTLISESKIRIDVAFATKWDAIAAAGDLLVADGHVDAGYPALMAARERLGTTYVGNGVAMPHGTREAMALVRTPGISVLQTRDGIDFGDGNIVWLVIGLAARGDGHLDLLTHLATVCADDAKLERLLEASTPQEMMAALSPEAPPP